MTLAGLPHSEIPGSKPVCGSPRLIAAYHVLLRLSAPRHPPCTLSSLTNLKIYSLPGESYRFLPDSIVNEQDPSGVRVGFDHSKSPRIPEDRCHDRGFSMSNKEPCHPIPARLVELIGFEPTTSALQGRRSPN
jgi:hypothetical protein